MLRLIDQQGKLDEEIKAAVEACEKLSQVEDLYRPYQQKRKTRAGVGDRPGTAAAGPSISLSASGMRQI